MNFRAPGWLYWGIWAPLRVTGWLLLTLIYGLCGVVMHKGMGLLVGGVLFWIAFIEPGHPDDRSRAMWMGVGAVIYANVGPILFRKLFPNGRPVFPAWRKSIKKATPPGRVKVLVKGYGTDADVQQVVERLPLHLKSLMKTSSKMD